ncbi:hypothetical protein [Streptomyces sp. NBC_01477]|uniref:hypothetical protein n=1 Tax=Streptomyces sp. NBC_01477 TaxID=2976015 RepID=UPI002E37A413|nr:hypothetical protein [Streptomyces sp. NBC_01477]
MAAEFTYYFRSLVAALGERPGWYGLYAQREPGAARAHETGLEVPPWDVVRTVLRDLAVNSGAGDVDPGEAGRAYALHRAALAAEDAAPDAEARLRGRLAVATRARETAVSRAREAARAYAHHPTAPRANALAWTRDELTRTTSRCTDLHQRLAAVALPEPEQSAPAPEPETASAARRPRGARFAGAFEPTAKAAPAPEAARPAAPRGARFAGAPEAGAVALPGAPGAPAARLPRGARFAGAPEPVAQPQRPVADPRWAAEARTEAARLGRLRQSGESGAAYLVLSAAAEGPAERIPYVVRELERTGLAADVATLLWEIAALPPRPVADAVFALAADGRGEHSRTLLHQVAARAAGDVALVADLLHAGGRSAEAGELLETVARGRNADAAAAVARARPTLTDLLLAAAARVSPPCHRDLAAALHHGRP